MQFAVALEPKDTVGGRHRLAKIRPRQRGLLVAVAVASTWALAASAELAHARKGHRPRGEAAGACDGPVPSTDIDAPTPLTNATVSGCGTGKKVSYYYRFSADAGPIALRASGRNRPAGSAGALGVSLQNEKAEAICSISLGNVTKTTTNTETCRNPVAQTLVMRLDLDPESIDYRVSLDGPLKISESGASGPSHATPGAASDGALPSTDIDAPTPFVGPVIKGKGTNQATSYYFSLTVGPGEVTLTADGKNRPSASTSALAVTLQDSHAKKLCDESLGNSMRDERKVVSCTVDSRQRGILRVDLSPETIDWRVRVEGAVAPAEH